MPQRPRRREDPIDKWIPFIVALFFHGFLAGGMYGAGEVFERERPEPPTEFEVIEKKPEPPKPKPPPPPPPPKAEPQPPPPKEVKVQPKPVKRRVRRPRRVATKTTPNPPPTPNPEPPAPGPVTNNDEPAPEYTLPDPGTQGGVPVAKGKRNTRVSGTGGKGTNTGAGGKPGGTGAPAPKPVSVASIKVMPKLLAEPSYNPKDYPPEAKRRGIQGQVKVRIVVNDKGRVVSRRVVKRLGFGLDKWALRLARRLRFRPAIDTNGAKVNAQIVYTFTFVIPK